MSRHRERFKSSPVPGVRMLADSRDGPSRVSEMVSTAERDQGRRTRIVRLPLARCGGVMQLCCSIVESMIACSCLARFLAFSSFFLCSSDTLLVSRLSYAISNE
jgi:hypothetical protein